MMMAPRVRVKVGISLKKRKPIRAERMSSMYLKGATAEASAWLKAFRRQ